MPELLSYQATNNHLNFTPPPFQFLVGEIDFALFLSTLSISRPIADVSAPYSWQGTAELVTPINYQLLPESLDDLENPSRWARGVHPVKIYFKNILFATLRILEYYYDEETCTASMQLGDLLSLLADEAPAEDYKSMGFPACQAIPLSTVCSTALSKAGFPCIQIAAPGLIAVPPNKPGGSWVQFVQQYLGERGYWLYVKPDECLGSVRYLTGFPDAVLFKKALVQMEHYQRERSVEIPADKVIASGAVEKFAICDEFPTTEVTEDFALVQDEAGRDIRALQRRETVTILQRAILRPGTNQAGFPVPLQSTCQTVQIRSIEIDQALGVVFPDKYPGSTTVILTEKGTEYKGYDSQGRLRARYFKNTRLLGQILPDAFPGDRTMIQDAETTLEEYLEKLPGTIGVIPDGVLRRKEYTFKSLFAEGTEASEFEGTGQLVVLNGVRYRKAIKEQIFENWKGGGATAGEQCYCDRYKYSKRVWQREQEEISATEAAPFSTDQNYTEDVPYYRMGSLQLRADLTRDNDDSTPPAWETLEPECPTCQTNVKGEVFFATASVSPYRPKQNYINFSTLTSQSEAEYFARLVGTMQHQRYRGRSITLPLPDQYLANPTPFAMVYCHNGAYVMDSPQLNLAADGLELTFKGNYLGVVPIIPDPPLVNIYVPEPDYTEGVLQIVGIGDRVAEVGEWISIELFASGGDAPYTFTASGLPEGLAVSGALITGLLSQTGVSNISVSVFDDSSNTDNTSFSLTVQATLVASPIPPVIPVLPVETFVAIQASLEFSDAFASPQPAPIESGYAFPFEILDVLIADHIFGFKLNLPVPVFSGVSEGQESVLDAGGLNAITGGASKALIEIGIVSDGQIDLFDPLSALLVGYQNGQTFVLLNEDETLSTSSEIPLTLEGEHIISATNT